MAYLVFTDKAKPDYSCGADRVMEQGGAQTEGVYANEERFPAPPFSTEHRAEPIVDKQGVDPDARVDFGYPGPAPDDIFRTKGA